MSDKNFWRLQVGVGLGLFIVDQISLAPWCGPNCRVIMSDARGTLVQDLGTGFLHWV
jgi:hypothetical protein